jgi:hypothetical protein
MIDPAEFCETVLIDPETQRLFRLTPAEKLFLWHAFEQTTSSGVIRVSAIIVCGTKWFRHRRENWRVG